MHFHTNPVSLKTALLVFALNTNICCGVSGLDSPIRRNTPTSSPGRFSQTLEVCPPHLQSQGKAPWGRGWEYATAIYIILLIASY